MARPAPTDRRRPSAKAAGERRITVVLADDHEVVRHGLCKLLSAERDLRVVGEARDGRGAVELARTLRPDVVVLDVAMPRLNGLEAARQILAADRTARVLFLSAHCDHAYVRRAAELGAAGYVLKQSSLDELAGAIRAAHARNGFAGPSVAQRVGGPDARASDPARAPRDMPRLTPREAEVLQRIAEGRANKETAAELGISIKTVEKHRHGLMRKLDLHDVAGLTRYAVARGIGVCGGRGPGF